jgi:hypothetical protein
MFSFYFISVVPYLQGFCTLDRGVLCLLGIKVYLIYKGPVLRIEVYFVYLV